MCPTFENIISRKPFSVPRFIYSDSSECSRVQNLVVGGLNVMILPPFLPRKRRVTVINIKKKNDFLLRHNDNRKLSVFRYRRIQTNEMCKTI